MRIKPLVFLAALFIGSLGVNETLNNSASLVPPATSSINRRVNAPYTDLIDNIPFSQSAVFWFGQVNSTDNYTDVRVIYNDESLHVVTHIFDRLLWYDNSPTIEDMANWDAVGLVLQLDDNPSDKPSAESYYFVAQLNHWESRSDYQVAYQGNGIDWDLTSIPFNTTSGWRGEGLNNNAESRGWNVNFRFPFASFGIEGPPEPGSTWRLGLVVYDRDDSSGLTIPEQRWPESLDTQRPTTWGLLHFGIPEYNPGLVASEGRTIIRHGLDNADVRDVHVGGHTTCAEHLWPNFFDNWGDANYAGFSEVNIQNQWDVADWPCFSKYYVTFPLDTLPAGKTISKATLTMYQFGNAGQDSEPGPEPSLIQILTVDKDWDESTITWNNAPLVSENVASAWVEPLDNDPGHPGLKHQWDVSRAVNDAYTLEEPLRLALYSADSAQHSGKYFVSSNTGDWNEIARPSLEIRWGTSLQASDWSYLPLISNKSASE